jgi:AcrR family transcriptional regulator
MPYPRVTSRDKIIGAAAELFQERGFQNTTIDDISRHLGIAKPTVYQYIKSKGALLEAVFDELLARLTAEHGRALATSTDPSEQLPVLVLGYTRTVADLTTNFRVFFKDDHELPPGVQAHLAEFSRRTADDFSGVIAGCITAGSLPSGLDPRLASFLIIGMIASIARWYEPAGPLDPDALAAQVLTLIGYQGAGRAAR